MFSRLTRLPLRRCLHTIPPHHPPSYSRLRFTLGASAVVAATYLSWRLSSDSHRILLDSVPSSLRQSYRSFSEKVFILFLASTRHSTSASQDLAANSPDKSLTPEPQVEASGSAESSVLDASGLTAPPNQDTSTDAGSGGAFNPVTGEINWDCPCLGGMAHGPCGPQFREAFSCFVFSEEEPKGINCVEMFKAMQTCFREHPEIYGDGTCYSVSHRSYLCTNSESEIDEDEDEQPSPVPTSTEDADVTPSDTGDIPEMSVDSASTGISKPRTQQAQKEPQSQVQASATH